jgi:Ribonuclease G/E
MDGILSISDYQPDYIERDPEPCPHCDGLGRIRTNRYLFRCTDCWRYW